MPGGEVTGGQRFERLYPTLLAAYPVVFVASANPGEFLWSELAALVALALLAGAAVHALANTALRGAPRSTVALSAAAANAWLFCAPSVADRMPGVPPRYTLSVLLVAGVAAVAWARRSEARGAVISRTSGVFIAVLLLAAVASLVEGQRRGREEYGRSAAVRAIRAGLPLPSTLGHRPDVYVVILDNLANAGVMREVYGVDRRAFDDSLRAMGFEVPAVTHSNYCNTAPSLAAFLNGQQVVGLAADLGADARDRYPLYRLSADNAVSRWFRAAGYAVYAQPSVGFPGTATNENATGTFGPPGLERLRLLVARGNLLPIVRHMSVPGRAFEHVVGEPARAEERLVALRSLPSAVGLPGPKLVIAHSLAAHRPYVYDSTCAIVAAPRSAADVPGAYRAAAACTERLVLAAVRAIVRGAAQPPVIVLQADHGTEFLAPPQHDSAARITAAQARECTGAFGAYLIPGVTLPDTVSPVNAMRYVIRSLGGLAPPVRDAAYFNSWEWPYRFVEVTSLLAATPTVPQLAADSPP